MHTLAIDIGGTGIKMLVLDDDGAPASNWVSSDTPKPSTPDAVFREISTMAVSRPPFDRVAVGFPGIVKRGIAYNAPNLGDELWAQVSIERELGELLHKPTRAVNDVDMQGHGVSTGEGMEMVLTLGTGLGSAVFTEGCLAPNLELGHHPFTPEHTYEQYICDAELKRIGAEAWSSRVQEALAQIEATWNYDTLHLGGGNVHHLEFKLAKNVRKFTSAEGLRGGVRLWD